LFGEGNCIIKGDSMAEDAFDKYLGEINKAYLRGDATEHTHRLIANDLRMW